ncbi:unnamed protein product [Oikopleura dioica]|uniref:Uncharacterized protein n=1 Tax=Oikopleura dioica TaxID=34765 RepID=E4XJ20_OIKDI|nr:unnamed protein product [Oikopleura dioica]
MVPIARFPSTLLARAIFNFINSKVGNLPSILFRENASLEKEYRRLAFFFRIRKSSSVDLSSSWRHFHHHSSSSDSFPRRGNKPISLGNENSNPRSQTFKRSCSYPQKFNRHKNLLSWKP